MVSDTTCTGFQHTGLTAACQGTCARVATTVGQGVPVTCLDWDGSTTKSSTHEPDAALHSAIMVTGGVTVAKSLTLDMLLCSYCCMLLLRANSTGPLLQGPLTPIG